MACIGWVGPCWIRRPVRSLQEYEYCYKFEIKYCGKIVLTDPFNYTVVVVHDLARHDSVRRRARESRRNRNVTTFAMIVLADLSPLSTAYT
jgi:hypothetical protein